MWRREPGPSTARIVPQGLADALAAELGKRKRRELDESSGKKSAVLMPMFELDGAVHVLLLRRAEKMRRHGGQVAFPGGRFDPEDTSLAITALREAEEEVGLPRAHVRILGALDDLPTITGYVVTPFAAWLDAPPNPKPNAAEVARVFSAPLTTFIPKPRGIFPRIGYHVEGEFVWGATCAILRELMAVVVTTPSFIER